MKKVCQLTSAHPASDIRIFVKECCTLAAEGYDTHLIATNVIDEEINGVHIHGVYKAQGGRLSRMTKTVWAVYKKAIELKAEIYHFHDSELIPIGILLKLMGKKVIYDVHEDLPLQILSKDWIPKLFRGLAANFARIIEGIGARIFDAVVAATPSIAKRFPDNKTVIVQNYPVIGEIQPAGNSYKNREPLIAYIGGLTVVQGVREMVNTMEVLPESLNAKLVLAGKFHDPVVEKEMMNLPGWNKVEFLGWQNREGIVSILNRAKIGIVIDHPILNYLEGYSTKMFEYMLAGIPIIASDFPFWIPFIKDTNCGIQVNPYDNQEVAKSIAWLLENPGLAEEMGKRGQDAIYKKYNWDIEAKKLIDLYKGL